jgi:hypothetical protein
MTQTGSDQSGTETGHRQCLGGLVLYHRPVEEIMVDGRRTRSPPDADWAIVMLAEPIGTSDRILPILKPYRHQEHISGWKAMSKTVCKSWSLTQIAA